MKKQGTEKKMVEKKRGMEMEKDGKERKVMEGNEVNRRERKRRQ